MKPKNYPATVHHLDPSKIDPHAIEIVETLQHHGYEAYIVGGSIRDLLLGGAPKDFDISTSATPEEIKSLFRRCFLIGRRFRLAHVHMGGKTFEVSTFRKGDNSTKNLVLRDNEWGSIREDALRRDFTINALFYNPKDHSIVDYVEGYLDTEKHLLETIGDPIARFKQDPVRMLRLIKFEARFSFKIAAPTKQALYACRKEITKSSPERIFEELLRMLESGASKVFFSLLETYGFLPLFLPKVSHWSQQGEENSLHPFLDLIDLENTTKPLPRTVLLAAFLYPLIHDALCAKLQNKKQAPHLGELQRLLNDSIDSFFAPFFQLPKRFKYGLVDLFTSQYRFTPLLLPHLEEEGAHTKRMKRGRTRRKIRIPRSSSFRDSLTFLELRSKLDPTLSSTYEEWQQAYEEHLATNPPPPKRSPPRRKRFPLQKHRASKPRTEHPSDY